MASAQFCSKPKSDLKDKVYLKNELTKCFHRCGNEVRVSNEEALGD